jgi:hypothetical protein
MGNILNDLWKRIVIDYKEWRMYQRSLYDVKRDRKAINRALMRARIKNKKDGRTYYILRDVMGGINELNRNELEYFTRKRLFKKMNYLQRLKNAIAIVTSNKIIQEHYNEIQTKKKKR